MSFLERIGFIETEEQERERLAQSPEGSSNHHLSTLPITIREWPQDLLIELPGSTMNDHRIVVVPIDYRKDLLPDGVEEEPKPRKRNAGSWTCAVVSSDHRSYPVGGYRIVISSAELARGRKLSV
jgi:hypothetical protein